MDGRTTDHGPTRAITKDPSGEPWSNKPAPVPLHWQEQVLEELNRDVALGVLERVPYGQPTEWCFRMVVTRKKDGSPRRTVDLSPLNKFCLREAHSSRSPFQLARSVPHHAHKSVFDAWNGYHSIPLRVPSVPDPRSCIGSLSALRPLQTTSWRNQSVGLLRRVRLCDVALNFNVIRKVTNVSW